MVLSYGDLVIFSCHFAYGVRPCLLVLMWNRLAFLLMYLASGAINPFEVQHACMTILTSGHTYLVSGFIIVVLGPCLVFCTLQHLRRIFALQALDTF